MKFNETLKSRFFNFPFFNLQEIFRYYDFVKSVVTIAIILFLDMITFMKCRISGAKVNLCLPFYFFNIFSHVFVFQTLRSLTSHAAVSRQKNEINFVMQVTLKKPTQFFITQNSYCRHVFKDYCTLANLSPISIWPIWFRKMSAL